MDNLDQILSLFAADMMELDTPKRELVDFGESVFANHFA